MSIREHYQVPTVKTYTLTEGQRIALEFMARKDCACGTSGFVTAIKFLRAEFDLGLRDAKDLADQVFGR